MKLDHKVSINKDWEQSSILSGALAAGLQSCNIDLCSHFGASLNSYISTNKIFILTPVSSNTPFPYSHLDFAVTGAFLLLNLVFHFPTLTLTFQLSHSLTYLMDIALCLTSLRPTDPDIFTFSESVSPVLKVYLSSLNLKFITILLRDGVTSVLLLVFKMPFLCQNCSSASPFLHYSQIAEYTWRKSHIVQMGAFLYLWYPFSSGLLMMLFSDPEFSFMRKTFFCLSLQSL